MKMIAVTRLASKKELKIVERIKQSFKNSNCNLRPILSPISIIILIITISNVFGNYPLVSSTKVNNNGKINDQQITDSIITAQQADKQQHKATVSALEDELNSIVKQHDEASLEANNRQLAETIISRLMLDNLTGSNVLNNNNNDNNNNVLSEEADSIDQQTDQLIDQQNVGELMSDSYSNNNNNNNNDQPILAPNAYEAMKLKKLLSMIQQFYENPNNNGKFSGQLPLLPNGQMATMKRATARIGNYLHNQQRQTNGYPRNNFDFGLGKRPDGNVLRFGDSLTMSGGTNGAGSGIIHPVTSQFGKRPSSHRYDFGLGKRVASVSFSYNKLSFLPYLY